MQEPGDLTSGPPPGPVGRPLPAAPPPPPSSYWWVAIVGAVFVVALVAAVVAIAAVAGDDDDRPATPPASTRPATTPAPPPAEPAPPRPTGGERYDDPQGAYSLTIDPRWTEITEQMADGTEAWAVAASAGGFAANLNVVTDDARGLALDAYVRASTSSLQQSGANVIESGRVAGTDGATLATMRYAATPAGSSRRIEFAAVVAVGGSHAVVATLTAPTEGFEAVAAEVLPYLLTLRAAG